MLSLFHSRRCPTGMVAVRAAPPLPEAASPLTRRSSHGPSTHVSACYRPVAQPAHVITIGTRVSPLSRPTPPGSPRGRRHPARVRAGGPAREVLGRIRSDRVLRLPKPPGVPGTNGRPPMNGPEFALAKPATWPEPEHTTTTEMPRYGP
ncbi:transposase [Kitasatospora aureofaciens]|uniref:transposase n=1 Tax=Kitasatospora aureofaciens TaxID=1894 RepID=UPI0036F48785